MLKHCSLSSALIGALVLCPASTSAALLQEDFSSDPSHGAWGSYGDSNLFRWNSTNQNLEATWNSSRPNSYFYHPLGTILAIDDEFSLEFDLQLNDANATGFFELAVGLLNISNATSTAFSRANAVSPNLFELDYFPDGGFGPTINATLADRSVSASNTSGYYFAYDTIPLFPGISYHIRLAHAAGAAAVTGVVSTNGNTYTTLPNSFAGPISDFRLDTLSISSYTTTDDPYGDSILAHGTVDNFTVIMPPLPVQNLSGAFNNHIWQAHFTGRPNWLYALERTTDFRVWTQASTETPGIQGTIVLSDSDSPGSNAFYRVRARRP